MQLLRRRPRAPYDIRDFIDGQAPFYAGTANVVMQLGRPAGFHRWVNTGFLPPRFREAMGLAWTAEDEARFTRRMRAVGARNERLSRVVRSFPINYFLWNFRVRVRLGLPLV